MIRVVIDTNIWISFLIGKILSNLEDVITHNRIQFVFSNELLEEISAVLQRPKFSEYFDPETVNEFVSLLLGKYELIHIEQKFTLCRDPKDNFLLDLCVAGHVDYLVTGDADLLALNPFQKTEIIDYKSFQIILNDMNLV